MPSCEPARFCPDHPNAPWLSLLAAAGVLGTALFALAAVALVWAADTAARRIHHRRATAPEDTGGYP
ncbi:hypothetical protein [Streptomyces sp. T028]|uniref:hypothetical protein n=1 Tax=Streptomyces sp. T028 TaxID=3394379 RepID=UPI003A863CAB